MKVFFPFKCSDVFASACDKTQRPKISTTKHTEESVTLTKFKGKLGYISHQEQSCHQVKERMPWADPGPRIQMCHFTMGLSPTGPERRCPSLHHCLWALILPCPCTHTGQKCPEKPPNQGSTYSSPRRMTGQVTILKVLGQGPHSWPGWWHLHTWAHLANTQGTQSYPWQSRGTKISQALKEGMIKISFLKNRERGKRRFQEKIIFIWQEMEVLSSEK